MLDLDKQAHLLVSFAIVWIFFLIFCFCRHRRHDSGPIRSTWGIIAMSGSLSFIVGLIKELNDYLQIGNCPCQADPLDILANVYGILAAVGGLSLCAILWNFVPGNRRVLVLESNGNNSSGGIHSNRSNSMISSGEDAELGIEQSRFNRDNGS